jgi:L-erythro-3,5-diaminohexanoate dehydrogenase
MADRMISEDAARLERGTERRSVVADQGGSPFGVHRVIAPRGALPQQAERLDPSPPPGPGEVLIAVERLNLDAASFHQIREEQGGDPGGMRARVADIVRARGKMHNPVTGSGGMLIGTVSEVGEGRTDLRAGDRIATLVSLTLTPLELDDLAGWDGSSEQVPASGHAILFQTAAYARLPDDLPDRLCLAVLDVAGAPAQVRRLAPAGRTVVVGGAGKAGLLAMAAAAERSASTGAVVRSGEEEATLHDLGFEEVVVADATDAVATLEAASGLWGGGGNGVADLVVNCVNVPGAEGASILLCREGGAVCFFSMATSFTAAALLAEGLGKDVGLIIGSGYVPGHAELALDMVRQRPDLRAVFERRSAS